MTAQSTDDQQGVVPAVLKFILRRALWSIPVLLLVIFLTFLLMKAIPGGPFTSEKAIPPEILANMNAKYGLSDPFYMQYVRYVWLALHGDLGVSMTQKGRTVMDVIRHVVPRVHAPGRSWPSSWPCSSAYRRASSPP